MRDRADTVATAMLQITLRHIVDDWDELDHIAVLRERLADYLRDEFEDLARQVAAERDNPCNEED